MIKTQEITRKHIFIDVAIIIYSDELIDPQGAIYPITWAIHGNMYITHLCISYVQDMGLLLDAGTVNGNRSRRESCVSQEHLLSVKS